MKNKQKGSLILILCFTLFILLGFVLHLTLRDREYSADENRYLAQAPEFTFKRLFSGEFTADFEDYITDQFPMRDGWLDLKSRFERFCGKTENNGVFFGRKDTLLTRFEEPDKNAVLAAAEAVKMLADHTGIPVYLALIPSSTDVWSDRLPKHANTADQGALIETIYDACGVNTVDIRSILLSHADEDIYYRTDHHWTTLGAYYGYAASVSTMGVAPQRLSSFHPQTVSDRFNGTAYSSSGVRWVEPDSIQRYVDAESVTLIRYDTPEGVISPVYDESKLEVKDKYSYFLGGNTSRLIVSTGHSGPKLLVIRDSYMDSELPFLFAHYSEIHVLDLRYFRQSVVGYAEEQDFDAILVSYSLSDFVTDTSVPLMGY